MGDFGLSTHNLKEAPLFQPGLFKSPEQISVTCLREPSRSASYRAQRGFVQQRFSWHSY
jgi:hypothetical protein